MILLQNFIHLLKPVATGYENAINSTTKIYTDRRIQVMKTIAVFFLCFSFLMGFSQNIRSLDSIAKFFNESEIEKLIELDKSFSDFVLNGLKDTNEVFTEYINNLISDIDTHGYYTCSIPGLLGFSKLNLEPDFMSSTAYNKIFCEDIGYRGSKENQKKFKYSALNYNGIWVIFINYYLSVHQIEFGSEYVDAFLTGGDFPHFFDSLPFYRDNFDYRNQVNRLLLMFHIFHHTSIYDHKDCISTLHNN